MCSSDGSNGSNSSSSSGCLLYYFRATGELPRATQDVSIMDRQAVTLMV